MRPWLRRFGRLGLLLLACSFGLLLLELGVRLAAPQQLIELRPDVWQPDHEGLGWRQREGIDTTINTGERTVRLVTGDHGHRVGPDAREVAPASRRVLVLGDSFTVGLQVEYEDLFTALLERSIAAELGESAEVVNTAVGGWGPSHYLIETRRELSRSSFDVVLVALFAGNDIEPQRIEHFPPKDAAIVHSLRLPRGWTKRELVRSFAYPLNDTLERRSHAFVLARAVLWRQLMRLGLSARSLPESLLRSEAHSPRWSVTANVVAELVEVARERGIPTVVCLIPGAYQVNPNLAAAYAKAIGLGPEALAVDQPGQLLGPELARRGVTLIDLLETFRSNSAEGALHGRVDTHLSPRGHQVVATALHRPLVTSFQPTNPLASEVDPPAADDKATEGDRR